MSAHYIIQYPPNTKDAKYIDGIFTLVVYCPHCGKKHHHNKVEKNKAWIKATCGRGYYILNTKVDRYGGVK